MSLQRISGIDAFSSSFTPVSDDEIKRQQAAEMRNVVAKRLKLSGIEDEFHGANLDRCEKSIQDFATQFYAGSNRSLIIQGDTGNGKTYSACAIAIKAMETIPARFIDAASLGSAAMDDNYASILKGTSLLILDDLGNEHRSEWSNAFLFSLLKRRMANNRPTIITTQYTDQELAGQLSQSADLAYRRTKALLSRFSQNAIKVRLQGQDWRVKNKEN